MVVRELSTSRRAFMLFLKRRPVQSISFNASNEPILSYSAAFHPAAHKQIATGGRWSFRESEAFAALKMTEARKSIGS